VKRALDQGFRDRSTTRRSRAARDGAGRADGVAGHRRRSRARGATSRAPRSWSR
jgi:hypothetical protein